MSVTTKRLAQMLLDRATREQFPPEATREKPPVDGTVTHWLARATAAHLAYRQELTKVVPSATTRLIPPALEEAAYCRAQAEQLDP